MNGKHQLATPCVTFRLVVAPLRGPGQSPFFPSHVASGCCFLSAAAAGACWYRFRVRGAQWLVWWGCAECGMVCRLRVSVAQ